MTTFRAPRLCAGALAFMIAGCCEVSNPYADFTLEEEFILVGKCDPACSPTHMSFTSRSPGGRFGVDALALSINPEDGNGFEYCLSYFDSQTCGESDLRWMQISAAHLTIPCASHQDGVLIEVRRGERGGGGNHASPSYWFAYHTGAVAVLESETNDEILPVFNCASE